MESMSSAREFCKVHLRGLDEVDLTFADQSSYNMYVPSSGALGCIFAWHCLGQGRARG